MRIDRRSTATGLALIGLAAVLLVDPVGIRSAIGSWFRVADPASGSLPAVATAIQSRAATVDTLDAALDADPLLSLAILATGLGVGLIAGSTVAFLHQRRRVRGERGD